MNDDRIALGVTAFANLPSDAMFERLVGRPFPEIEVDGLTMTGLRSNPVDILAFNYLLQSNPGFSGNEFRDAYRESCKSSLASSVELNNFLLYPSKSDLRYLLPKHLFGLDDPPNALQDLFEEHDADLFKRNSFHYLATRKEFLGVEVDLANVANNAASVFRSDFKIYFALESLLDLVRVEAYMLKNLDSHVEDTTSLMKVIHCYHRAQQGLPMGRRITASEKVQKTLLNRWMQPSYAEKIFNSYLKVLEDPDKIQKISLLFTLGLTTEEEQNEHDNTPNEWLTKIIGER